MIAATGEILFEKNAYEKRGIASTTKIMTCITAIENADLWATTVVTAEDIAVEGTSMGLRKGDTVDLYTLLKGMLLESGNDAANVTATLVAGGRSEFAELMNFKAYELGMNNTCFKNPSGLTEEGHYSCAYDMALLGSYAIKNKVFRSICSSKRSDVTLCNGEARTLYNHNKLLGKYEGAFGIKTGFTKASGRCLVSAVERNDVVLVAVTLNAYDDWNDHIKLYDYCFGLLSVNEIDLPMKASHVAVVNSKKSTISLRLYEKLSVPYYKTIPEYEVAYYIPRFVYAGIRKGDYIGWAEVYTKSGMLVDKIYIVAGENAPVINSIEKDRR
jgi:D-alanyl-D-alanine carboxypeptidase/D-alanyl-D-alanine carboxypeptidase (penicillin-binding protein 5/6)